MSLKYSSTTADYMDWQEMINLVRRLAGDRDYKMSLLISIGCFWGLRISDMLSLRWKDILNVNEFTIQEKKTGKKRTIRINQQLKRHILDCYNNINPVGVNSPILVSQKGTVFTIQRILLKDIKEKYRLKVSHFSCHSLRKTFGRQVYNMNSDNAEMALIKLMELFNHSSVGITKHYLGFRQKKFCKRMNLFLSKIVFVKRFLLSLWQFLGIKSLN
jgi:integrase